MPLTEGLPFLTRGARKRGLTLLRGRESESLVVTSKTIREPRMLECRLEYQNLMCCLFLSVSQLGPVSFSDRLSV